MSSTGAANRLSHSIVSQLSSPASAADESPVSSSSAAAIAAPTLTDGSLPAKRSCTWAYACRIAATSASSSRPCPTTNIIRSAQSSSTHVTIGAMGCPISPCSQAAPSGTGTPRLVSVVMRPPGADFDSITVTERPASCSRRAATMPAMPAPTTSTRCAPAWAST